MISGPKNSRPTLRGWVNLATNQLVKEERLTKAQIDEWESSRNKDVSKNERTVNDVNINDPLGLSSMIEDDKEISNEYDIPEDLGLETLEELSDSDFEKIESYREIEENYHKSKRRLGETRLEVMRKSGELDYFKNILDKTLNKK
jgi:hypothetical protein